MFWVSIVFSFYFFSLFFFSLVSHAVYYCGFLVLNSLMCSLLCYMVFGFSWYALLFCLVYMGGVYMLFVFVSVHSPNSKYITQFNLKISFFVFLAFLMMVVGCVIIYAVLKVEFSSFLCSGVEGKFYVIMCFTLLFGFLVLSMIMCVKLNYYR